MAKLKKRPKLPSVVLGIQDVDALTENIVALLYGKASSGKTRTAATFPGRRLFLDINNEKGASLFVILSGTKQVSLPHTRLTIEHSIDPLD